MDYLNIPKFKCSECGKEFTISTNLSEYKYRAHIKSKLSYQCGYTCYDHALLRTETPDDFFLINKYKASVSKCENTMKGQGKIVLHPIKV